jgi:hypothetical protein
VADIFFSYSRRDRERVGLVRNALAEMGFEVFWDQETPSGSDWDTWIRVELAKSKCAVVFWSATSTVSDNVRHEAVVAKEQRKLISVFLDQLPAHDLPMGFYSQQAADLSKWDGDQEDTEWRKFRREFEAKLMPRWVQQKLNDVDAELEGERAKRQTAEAHEKSLRARISTEAKIQQDLKRERDQALAEASEFKVAVEERDKGLQSQIAKQADIEQGLKTERDRAVAEVARLTATVEGLSRALPDEPGNPTKRWLSPIAVGIVLLAAVAGAFLSLSPGRKADGEAGARFAELTATVTKSDKARQDAEAKADQATAALTKSDKARQDAEAKATQTAAALAKSEQARQAAEAQAADAEKARQVATAKVADAEKARQTAETKAADAEKARQAASKTADDAEKARQAATAKAAEADKARLAAEVKATGTVTGLFTLRRNTEAKSSGYSLSYLTHFESIASVGDCEQACARSDSCKVFTYSKRNQKCFTFKDADLVANEDYDSGIRATVATVASPVIENASQTVSGFTIRPDTTATGPLIETRASGTINDCGQRCTNK